MYHSIEKFLSDISELSDALSELNPEMAALISSAPVFEVDEWHTPFGFEEENRPVLALSCLAAMITYLGLSGSNALAIEMSLTSKGVLEIAFNGVYIEIFSLVDMGYMYRILAQREVDPANNETLQKLLDAGWLHRETVQ